MSEDGQSWRRSFRALPAAAQAVRHWTRKRVQHPDAPAVANELYLTVLQASPEAIEMTLSTAGLRVHITARSDAELIDVGAGVTLSHQIISALSTRSGATPDAHGKWAQLAVLEDPCATPRHRDSAGDKAAR